GLARGAGPSLGGVLVDWQGGRSVFYVTLLIGVPSLPPARRLLRESREPQAALPDALGALLLAGGVGALALAIVEGPDWGWSSSRVLGAFAASALLLGVFVWRSSRHPAPVIELSLFRVRSFAVANASAPATEATSRTRGAKALFPRRHLQRTRRVTRSE